MKKYLFWILLLCTSCLEVKEESKKSERAIKDFYENYSIYKLKKMTKIAEVEDSEILDKTEDKCIINYLSKEIDNKRTDYQNYLLKLPVNKTDKYDKLIIDLTIKSAGSLKENWDFMHIYLNNFGNIDRLFKLLSEYDSNDIYLFFLVYFKNRLDFYPNIGEDYYKEEVKMINNYGKLKNELLTANEKFIALNEWEMKSENQNYGSRIQYFSVEISHSLLLYGEIYNKKSFVLFLEEKAPSNSPLKIIYCSGQVKLLQYVIVN